MDTLPTLSCDASPFIAPYRRLGRAQRTLGRQTHGPDKAEADVAGMIAPYIRWHIPPAVANRQNPGAFPFAWGDFRNQERAMRNWLGVLAGALLAGTLMTIPPNALACNEQHGNCDHDKHQGAPGPIVGAGLPILAVGFGVYWLVKRRRRKSD
jgi:hypothetical protein